MDAAALYYELSTDVDANRKRLLDGLERGLRDAELAVGPEVATIGIGLEPSTIRDAAEPIDGRTVTEAQEIVDRLGGTAAFGLPERADGLTYNACVVLEPDSEPRVYRQREYPVTHSWTTGFGEDRVFETGCGRLAPVVCAELTFREKRNYLGSAEADADVIAAPANWAEADSGPALLDRWAEWSTELELPMVVANVACPAGGERGYAFDGPTAIIDRGTVVERSRDPGDVIVGSVRG